MFKNVNEIPPGGWRFYQPEIDWPKDSREFRGIGLDATVDKIYQKRAANPRFNLSLDRDKIRQEVLNYTEAVVRKMKGTETYFINDAPAPEPPSFPLARSLAQRVAEVAGTVKKQLAGIGLLTDWLGDGLETVSPELATERAKVCATSGKDGTVCPFNEPPRGLQRVSSAVAEDLRLLMEAKREMKLQTPYDGSLHTCQICACHLPLKIWAPMEHLKRKTPADVLEQFKTKWPACWMNR